MVDHKTMTQELIAKLGFDNIRALVKATTPTITEQQLSAAANAVMNRRRNNGEKKDG
jgi:hypothetical protein